MPDPTEICSLADLKTYLTITGATKDTVLQLIKDQVEAAVKAYCGRDFVPADFVEYYDGDDGAILRVEQRPIISIASIYSDPSRLWPASSLIPATEYNSADDRDMSAGLISLISYRFLRGRKATKISYRAGYATMPKDLAGAVQQICAKEYTVQDKRMFGMQTETVGDKTITFSAEEWPKGARQTLDRFRRIAI